MSDSSTLVSSPVVPEAPPAGMVWIPGGTFRMGSDEHYPEEAPAQQASVDGFWMDQCPVTNRQFEAFVQATGHRTLAEIAPDPAQYPGGKRELMNPGSLVFKKPGGPVDMRDFTNWWKYTPWRRLASSPRPQFHHSRPWGSSGGPRGLRRCGGVCSLEGVVCSPPRRNGSSPRAAASTARNTPGATR